jgi:hypothetical protein
MVVKSGGGELHDAQELKGGREPEIGVERCGWCSPFTGAEEVSRMQQQAIMASVNG